MKELTNKEFWILWRHRDGKPFDSSRDNCYYLSGYGYISKSTKPSSNPGKYEMDFMVCVNRDGVHAAQHHHDKYFEARWTSIRSWTALAVSIAALAVSANAPYRLTLSAIINAIAASDMIMLISLTIATTTGSHIKSSILLMNFFKLSPPRALFQVSP